MSKYILLALILLGLVSCGGEMSGQKPSAYKEGEVIVKFKSGADSTQRYMAHKASGAKSVKTLGDQRFERVKLPQGVTVEDAVKTYTTNPEVEYAEPNYIVKAYVLPNDARFNDLWGLHNSGQNVNGTRGTAGADIAATDAWNISTGSPSVIIAVLDTGIDYNHPDLKDNIWGNTKETSCTDGIDNDKNGYIDDCIGWNFVESGNDPADDNGHGTHIAGIMGAVGNNALGVAGVSWSVKIMSLKVLDNYGEGDIATIIEAISYAAAKNARIINMSFGSTGFSQSLYDAIEKYSNMLFIAAAGNEGANNDQPSVADYPASFGLPNIISVAATDQNDIFTSFSNYGVKSVDVAAPGTDILNTVPSFTAGITYSGTYRTVYFSFGFEGIDGALLRADVMRRVLEFNGVSPGDGILLVDDDGGNTYETYYKQALEYLGYSYDYYMVPVNDDGPDAAKLRQYKLVIWFTGNEYSPDSQTPTNVTPDDQANIRSFLDNGGRLFISGQDIGYDIGSTSFYRNYLHARFITDDANGSFYTGLNDFAGLSLDLSSTYGNGAQNQRSIDAVKPLDGATAFYISYNDAYQFFDGTSMSTAMVSGVAALIASYYGDFTASQIKGTILLSVDSLPSLQGTILSGGRVNVYKSLSSLIAPTDLNAVLSGKEVVLAWTDNSSGETGFSIERKESAGKYAQIASVSSNQTNYTDDSVKAGKTYSYRVKAFNAAASSSYTNEASLKIPGVSSSGSGGCSGDKTQNLQTALADMTVLFMPLMVVFIIRRSVKDSKRP
jgi:subtilisin family serine protease